MKNIIMAASCQEREDIFDKVKSHCSITPEKENCSCSGQEKKRKENCGCQDHTKNQAMELTAIIIDKSLKAPLSGAHIVNTVTKQGVVSDDNGQFVIDADSDQLITISFVGMKDITLPASQITSTIEMEEDLNLLDEVIIKAKKTVQNNKAGFWVIVGLTSLYTYAKVKKPKTKKSNA